MLSIPFNATSAVVNTSINNGFTWGNAWNLTFCGIAIVFLMIVLLCVIIKIFGISMDKLLGIPTQKKEVKKPVINAPPAVSNKIQQNDDEIIAVISAAVASMYEGSGKKAVIKSIKRSNTKTVRNNWATAGLLENTRAF